MTTDLDDTLALPDDLLPDDPNKPSITAKEVSWYQAQAGLKTAGTARAQGGDPRVVEALMNHDPATFGDVTLQPLTLATLLTLQKANNVLAAGGDIYYRDMAEACWIFHSPLRAFAMLAAKDHVAIQMEVMSISAKLPGHCIHNASRWMQLQIANVSAASSKDDDSEGKPVAPPTVG